MLFLNKEDLMSAEIPYTKDDETYSMSGALLNSLRHEVRCSNLLSQHLGICLRDLLEENKRLNQEMRDVLQRNIVLARKADKKYA